MESKQLLFIRLRKMAANLTQFGTSEEHNLFPPYSERGYVGRKCSIKQREKICTKIAVNYVYSANPSRAPASGSSLVAVDIGGVGCPE